MYDNDAVLEKSVAMGRLDPSDDSDESPVKSKSAPPKRARKKMSSDESGEELESVSIFY